MNKQIKIGLWLSLLAVALVSTAVVYTRHVGVAVLNPKGPIAYQERNLIFFGLALSLVVVVPVFVIALAIAWRYRESNTKATYTPDWDHSVLAETVWWGVPAVLISILSVVAWNSSHTLDPAQPLTGPAQPMTIQVVALDWKWLFIYPRENIATINFVQFPANAPVDFEITSDAPMNSFWIPQLGGQIYAMPGMSTQLHLLADTRGNFYGSSANISGRGFADMHFTARATSPADFYRWVGSVKRSPNRLSVDTYNHLARPSINNPQAYYALQQPDLYTMVLDKYMSPGTMTGMYTHMGMN